MKHINDFFARYVTAGARMYLYTYLDILQEKALYCDNDSVVNVQPRGRTGLVETGYCSGAKTSEHLPGHHICEFVGPGLKNYAIQYNTIGHFWTQISGFARMPTDSFE